jgi:hypothetical protein
MLSAAFDIPVIHSPGPIENCSINERLFWCTELCKVPRLIMDRCYYFSELVYGPILRKESMITLEDTITFLDELKKHKHLLIFCDQRFKMNTQPSGVIENIMAIDDAYGELFYEYIHPEMDEGNLMIINKGSFDYPLLLSYARSVL